MDQEDSKIQKFRRILNEWKRDTLFPGLNNEGDKESIERRVQEAQILFFTLMNIMNEKQVEKDDPEVKKILEPLGEPNTWSESLLDNVRHILFTDLYEYPLTFNVILIDQFTNQEDEDFPIFQ